jgi:transcriptional regulator with XRE-family HTH domain
MAKRQTIGQRLRQAREQAGLSVPQLVQRIRELHGKDVGASTVRDAENDKTPNPGIKTIECIAKGVQLDPMEIIGLALENPPESEPGYSETQFAQLARVYKKVSKENRPVADQLVKMLIEQMERWR